jgi:hypothetical protein
MIVSVDPLLHKYVNGDVPPLTVTDAEPFACSQVEFIVVTAKFGEPILFRDMILSSTHPLSLVTEMVYKPALTKLKSSVVVPLLQRKVNGAIPPVTVTSMAPLLLPQVDKIVLTVISGKGVSLMVTAIESIQLLSSVTST